MEERETSTPAGHSDRVADFRSLLARLQRAGELVPEDGDRGAPAGLRRRAQRLLQRASRPFLGAQVRFNAMLVRLLGEMLTRATHRIADVEYFQRGTTLRLDALQRDLQRLGPAEEHLRSLDARTGAQEALALRVEASLRQLTLRIEARLAALDRELPRERAHVEVILARLEDLLRREERRGGAATVAAEEVRHLRARTRSVAGISFEDLHRGARGEIKERLRIYLSYFAGADAGAPVLDLGCGRGEFLELAGESGLCAEGVDYDPEMIAACRERGFVVHESDALEHLRPRPDGSLSGILMTQVIEHLTLDQMTELVALAAAKLRPGAAFIAETVNPECLSTFANTFYLDLTHIRPVHPEAARFLWRWAGLSEVEILRLSPHDESDRLELAPSDRDSLAGMVNRNAERLNRLLFGFRDYAVVGRALP